MFLNRAVIGAQHDPAAADQFNAAGGEAHVIAAVLEILSNLVEWRMGSRRKK